MRRYALPRWTLDAFCGSVDRGGRALDRNDSSWRSVCFDPVGNDRRDFGDARARCIFSGRTSLWKTAPANLETRKFPIPKTVVYRPTFVD